MTYPLFYTETIAAVGATAVLEGDEGFHAASVRRIRPGEQIVLSDGVGTRAHCVIDSVDKRSVTARIVDREVVVRSTPLVRVVQAIPKSERSELAIELVTEAGADEVIAWQASRCVARWDDDRAVKGLRRWRAVARSAARQSRRAYIPEVWGPVSTAALIADVDQRVLAGEVVLVLHESADDLLATQVLSEVGCITVIVGPEGGISNAEIDDLRGVGAMSVRLGPTVLRTSSAAAVALGALGVLTPRWQVRG